MSDVVVHNVMQATTASIADGFFLVLLNADKRPPHVALLVNGLFLSLETSGPVVNQNTDAFVRMVASRKIPTLFIELKLPAIATVSQIRTQAADIINQYNAVVPGVITCLAPVKQVVERVYALNVENVRFVYELLPLLREQGLVGRCFEYFLNSVVESDHSFRLRTYSMKDVIDNISRSALRGVTA